MKSNLYTIIILIFSFLLTYLSVENSLIFLGFPSIYFVWSLIFIIQFVVFIPSFIFKTEHYYDLTGGITFISSIILSLYIKGLVYEIDVRSILVSVMVCGWAVRLSTFLFLRVKKIGEDIRFKKIKKSFSRYLFTFTLQGFWVFMCVFPALIILNSIESRLDIYTLIGCIVWLFGFVFQVIADIQKSKFNKNKKGKFISNGLWSISRHPNYFGEFLIWTGVTIISLSSLSGFQYLVLLTPIFVYLLLNKVSGVNLLEEIGDRRWGHKIEYQNYKKNTPVFFPKLF